MSFSDDDKHRRKVVRKKKIRHNPNPLRAERPRSDAESSNSNAGAGAGLAAAFSQGQQQQSQQSQEKSQLELRLTSDRFARDLARLIQTQLSAAMDNNSETSNASNTSNGGGGAIDSIGSGGERREVLQNSSSLPRSPSAEALRRSNELPTTTQTSLRRVAALNSSPRRFSNADAAATAAAASSTTMLATTSAAAAAGAASSTATRSTDSSPRLLGSGVVSNDTSPRSPRPLSSSGKTLFSRLSRMASPRRSGTISAQQFLADDLLATNATARNMSAKIIYRRCIGGGGMAKIYEAEVKGMTIAVKVYNEHLSVDEEDLERKRLVRKIEAVCALPEHRNILSILGYRFEACRGSVRLLVAMPYMPTTLQALIQQRRKRYYGSRLAPASDRLAQEPFSRVEVLGMFSQIVDGVACLHQHGIWHRDLKGENILAVRCDYESVQDVLDETITFDDKSSSSSLLALLNEDSDRRDDDDNDDERGSDDSVEAIVAPRPRASTGDTGLHRHYCLKLADFDEICILDNLSAASSSSSSKSATDVKKASLSAASSSSARLSLHCGTLQFRAPEMVNTLTHNYDERVDVWSLGMILYILLTLELPFAREKYKWFQLQGAVENGERPSLPLGYLDSWADIVALYFICTEKNPDLRPDAAALLARISKM